MCAVLLYVQGDPKNETFCWKPHDSYDVRLQNYGVINFVPFFGSPCMWLDYQ